ncbi:hypothetical protein VPH35_049561 [Triticum aestivum]
MDHVNLDLSSSDARVPTLGGNSLCTSYFYKLLIFRGVLWAPASSIWDHIIPLKSRIFLWLAFWGRLNTKANMVRKGWSAVAPSAGCDACPAEETADHLILRCRPADAMWSRLSLATLACASPNIQQFVCQAKDHLQSTAKWHVAFAACAVTLWQARNDRVFNDKCWPESYIRFHATNLLSLWSNRATKQPDKDDLAPWITILSN